jgi:hypothetical protein
MRRPSTTSFFLFWGIAVLTALGSTGCAPVNQLNTLAQNFSSFNALGSAQYDLATDLRTRAEDAHEIYQDLYRKEYDTNKPVTSREELKKLGRYAEKVNLCKDKYSSVFDNGEYNGGNTDIIEKRNALLKNLAGMVKQLANIVDIANGKDGIDIKMVSNDLSEASATLKAGLTEIGDAAGYTTVGAVVSVFTTVANLAEQAANNQRALSQLRDLLNTDPAQKNSIWYKLQAAIGDLENTNSGTKTELLSLADVWEECQNSIILASGNVSENSPDTLKLSSAQLRNTYNADLHALSTQLTSDTNVKNMNDQLEKIRNSISDIHSQPYGNITPNQALNDLCQAGEAINTIEQAVNSSRGTSTNPGSAASAAHTGTAAHSVSHPATAPASSSQSSSKGAAQTMSCDTTTQSSPPASNPQAPSESTQQASN